MCFRLRRYDFKIIEINEFNESTCVLEFTFNYYISL